ncbi:ABC transporter permease [Oceanibaculum nanhaiense]|uniref:ABC transporter permease n=1 Tax=Oceanibaculum nanhaiense TaxID=1909734 RepID=UPI00396E57B5
MNAVALDKPASAALRRWTDFFLLIAGLVVVWYLLHLWAGEVALTSPYETVAKLIDLLGQAWFWPHVGETLLALAYSLLIASIGGLGLGTLLGIHRLSGQIAEPILVALYALPKITLYPLILLIFGLGLPAKVAFGAIHGIIPVTIFALNAVRNIKPVYLKTARVMRLTPLQAMRTVWVPAALPEIVSGQRIGFALTLLGVLLGEMFASQQGLGFLIMNAIGLNDVPTIMALALLLAIFAVIVSSILLAIDRHMHSRA